VLSNLSARLPTVRTVNGGNTVILESRDILPPNSETYAKPKLHKNTIGHIKKGSITGSLLCWIRIQILLGGRDLPDMGRFVTYGMVTIQKHVSRSEVSARILAEYKESGAVN